MQNLPKSKKQGPTPIENIQAFRQLVLTALSKFKYQI